MCTRVGIYRGRFSLSGRHILSSKISSPVVQMAGRRAGMRESENLRVSSCRSLRRWSTELGTILTGGAMAKRVAQLFRLA